jgi:hypothetical protein
MMGTSDVDDLEKSTQNELIGQCVSLQGKPLGEVSCTRESQTYGSSNNMYNWKLQVLIDCSLRCERE